MKQPVLLDDLDRRLLRALQADAAQSHMSLGETIGASSASCWRRVRALEAAGVLLGAVRLVDPASVGCGVSVLVQVRMKSHATEQRQGFEGFVRERPEIVDCHSMAGEWDYLMRVVAADVAGYERFLMGELLRHPNVAATASTFSLNHVKFTTALPV